MGSAESVEGRGSVTVDAMALRHGLLALPVNPAPRLAFHPGRTRVFPPMGASECATFDETESNRRFPLEAS